MNPEWEFYRQENGQWRWTRYASNGKVIAAATESYHNYADCEANARMSGYGLPIAEDAHEAE